MNIMVCDDDYLYVEQIKRNVENFFSDISQTVKFDTFTDGEEALDSSTKYYDIAFLDIELGSIKGTEIAERIKTINPHALIFFITAFNQYLDDAFDLNAFRFLTKPLDIKRLLNGLDTALDLIDKTTVEFMLKNGDKVKKVYSRDIVYVEISGRFTKVVTTQGEYSSINRMKFWAERLTSTNFYRIHNSYLINSNYITEYSKGYVVLNEQYNITVSYRARAAFKQYITKRMEDLQ